MLRTAKETWDAVGAGRWLAGTADVKGGASPEGATSSPEPRAILQPAKDEGAEEALAGGTGRRLSGKARSLASETAAAEQATFAPRHALTSSILRTAGGSAALAHKSR